MDRILLVDLHNAVWRASVIFGGAKHVLCSGDFECKHSFSQSHCVCGQQWNQSANRCSLQASDEEVIIFNFFRNLRPIIELFHPDKCFFVQEGYPWFRHNLLSTYKANRIIKQASKQETKDKVLRSKDEIVRLLQYLPVTLAKAERFEADDVIATLADNLKEENLTVLSSDSDYIQLLQRGYASIQIYDPMKKVFMTSPPEVYVAWKSLVGDKSDNIPRLVSNVKAKAFCNSPELFATYLSREETRAKFAINRKLVEFASVPEYEIVLQEGVRNFEGLKEEFINMKFESITNDRSWKRYVSTFDCLKF